MMARTICASYMRSLLTLISLFVARRTALHSANYGHLLGDCVHASRWEASHVSVGEADETGCIGVVHNYSGLLACRFFLGMFEGVDLNAST